ncbi:MAG TPA: alpha/beta fold hydrolase [Candidatus Limnocylindrales bacterium]|nr:alpha/beta fold hydrolase [Candidatus Limnocylindrales bacterium]
MTDGGGGGGRVDGARPVPSTTTPTPGAVFGDGPRDRIGPRPIFSSVPPELEERIRRDLRRGRRFVRLTWVAALASLVLGLVAIRQAALLVAIDADLVTTEEVQGAGATFDFARSVLIGAVVFAVALGIRWIRGSLQVLEELRHLGVIEGRPAGPGLARLGLLWRDAGVPAEQAGWADLRVPAGRRVAWLTLAAVFAAALVGLIAALWLGAARDAEMSRALRVASGLDGGLWLVASILVGVVADGILWREAAAARALGVFIPLVDAPGRAIVRLVPPVLVFVAGVLIASGRPEPWYVPCPQATLDCDGMLVPVDHDAGSTATIWIVYAVHHATEPSLGSLAVAVGGPGASGLDGSLAILESLDPELVRRYDILFWDQRGVGASEGRDCPDAGHEYALAEPMPRTAEVFVGACLREAGVNPADVARYATRQAAEDLESIRERLGIERIALYGESYGTELAQVYAARHPDRLSVLVLDGAVDLTLSSVDFWADAARSFDRVLSETFAACEADRDCEADVEDPAAAYDRTLRQFEGGEDVRFADADGVVRGHVVDRAAIEAAVGTLLYDPVGRMLIQRAVAAADNGDAVPLARLVNILGPGVAADTSSFAYHAVTCADYRVSPTSDPRDVAALEAAGDAVGVDELRTDEVFGAQYPCLYWPFQPADGSRPAPLTATPFPVFVLGATGDPITPIGQARTIAGRLVDGYLIETSGGPHVTFGRGEACVDGPVLRFLLDGLRPRQRTIHCSGAMAGSYIPLTAATAAGYADALDAMTSAESELFAEPEYQLWDGAEELRIGCRHGGFLVVIPGTGQDSLRFADCAFTAGLPLTGTGTYGFDDDVVRWTVTVPDGRLDYVSNADEQSVSGTWEGRPVELRR